MDAVTSVILDSNSYVEVHEKLCHSWKELKNFRDRIYKTKANYKYATLEDAFQHLKTYWKEKQNRAMTKPFQGLQSRKSSGFMQGQSQWHGMTKPLLKDPLTPEQERLMQEHHEMVEKENLAELRKKLRGE